MNAIDWAVIAAYFIVVTGAGFWYLKRASKNLEAYFLGDKSMNWVALAMSGSVSNFDITGTMWIVSMLVMMGMKSMWIHWMWGCMMGAFCLGYMGKWVRRSNAMTGAEWMVTRFGADKGGRVARTAYAFMAIVTLATFIGYDFQGIGKFGSVYLGWPPHVCAMVIIGLTTFYVLMGGLYSVVITDVIQTIILTLAAIAICAIAYNRLTPELLAQKLPAGWESLKPAWELKVPAGSPAAEYRFFGIFVIAWVLKGLITNAGGPAQLYDFQRFLAARDERDAAKIGAAWSPFMIVRWGMAMGIALLALTAAGEFADPEKAMPSVLRDHVPTGLRGFIIAGLIAAFMSTFSSTVNAGASYIVRDVWQPFFRPQTEERNLVRAGHFATIGIVLVGIAIGFQAKSIAQIWNWLMMALTAGVVMPNFLRWYWWRINGWGYAAGTLGGIALSVIVLRFPNMPDYIVFPSICAVSLLAAVIVSLATPPVDEEILIAFYRKVRPFGAWGDIKAHAGLNAVELREPSESPALAILNVCLGIAAITGCYLFPMYLVGHWHGRAMVCLAVTLGAIGALAKTWYPYLPRPQNPAKGE
ncbi:MAG TPA: Na+:solute symporter [Candidatus Brocadiia bacterium]|nr:Na+:solute symporter [Candidatus Brocadiia bacterium]